MNTDHKGEIRNMEDDKEIIAIGDIVHIIKPFGRNAQQNILRYCLSRAENWETNINIGMVGTPGQLTQSVSPMPKDKGGGE